MHRIDSDGTAVALPTPGAVGGVVGYFTKGNPGTGTPATVVSDDWANSVQEEIGTVITHFGGSFDKTKQDQLKDAILAAMEISVPVGSIMAWIGGHFGDGSNGSYTRILGTDNTIAAANAYLNPKNWYVCDGAALNDAYSPIFNGVGRYLPNLTDDRFLMGDTVVGGIGGSSTMLDHTHTHSLTAAGQTLSGNSGSVSSDGHAHYTVQTTTDTNNIEASGAYSIYVENLAVGYDYHLRGGVATPTTGVTNTDTHDHTVSISHTHSSSSVSGTIGTGSAASSTENRPKYLGCFYIMKVK